MTCPTPPTVMPSVGEGETGASGVQVPPCAYPACTAVKVPTAPATITRNHFRPLRKWSNIFLSSFGRDSVSYQKNPYGKLSLKGNHVECEPLCENRRLACTPAGAASLLSRCA